MQNIRRPVRRTFSEPTSAVAEGLRDHVRLMTTSIQPELALVVVCLSVATANRHGRYVRWTGRRTNTVRTADLRTLAAGIAFQLVARRRYRRYGVGCNQRENKSVKPIDRKLFDWNTNWPWPAPKVATFARWNFIRDLARVAVLRSDRLARIRLWISTISRGNINFRGCWIF